MASTCPAPSGGSPRSTRLPSTPWQTIRARRSWRREIACAQLPDRGLSYGLLRYLGNDASRRLLAGDPQPDLIFNYLGQFDQVVAGSSLFRFAPESAGPWHSPRARRRHAVEVLTVVREGRLEARLIFSRALHEQETIEQVAHSFIDALRELIGHCKAATMPRLTRSDFPLARVDEAGLERRRTSLSRIRGRLSRCRRCSGCSIPLTKPERPSAWKSGDSHYGAL